ncbi:metalloregulator ArsR/SmtB family transcription factor [Brachybacterium sp. YJGR34]|uniref:metalloregulator ArsR/SmtB family transcription factor n=1 Tax=Brachybacterium sp. YJGR34 TaxID=2059911 RepID=UPI000E0BA026|nr:metalloregulator ArsR/SmtB family transcription factor [Brachybacterium sp. YJGR34]
MTITDPDRTADEACAPIHGHAMGVEAAASVAGTLKALSDPLRLRMLSAIMTDPRGESCVCDLAELAEVSQPTVSHHLKTLRSAGLLTSERRGTWVWYRIPEDRRGAVTSLMDGFAPAALAPPAAESEDPPADVDLRLTHLAEELVAERPELSEDLVVAIVRESYTALARSARITAHLVTLTERFARQRLVDLTRDREAGRPQVLFVCVANAGRSQLAAALVRQMAGDRVVARSAGSAPATEVHPHVRSLLEEMEGAQSAEEPFPTPLTDDAVRAADVVITMGCGDVCPVIPGVRYEDWPVGDPALASPEETRAIRDDIAARVRTLLETLVPADS